MVMVVLHDRVHHLVVGKGSSLTTSSFSLISSTIMLICAHIICDACLWMIQIVHHHVIVAQVEVDLVHVHDQDHVVLVAVVRVDHGHAHVVLVDDEVVHVVVVEVHDDRVCRIFFLFLSFPSSFSFSFFTPLISSFRGNHQQSLI
jgi:hypothetical protein